MKIPSGLHVDNPAWPLLQSLISYIGVTSAAGNANGKTLICTDLNNEPSYDGLVVKLLSGNAAGQARVAQHHPASNTIVFGEPFTDNAGAVVQVVAGTRFVVLTSMVGGGGPGPSPEEGLVYYGVVDAVPGANQFTISPLAGLGASKFLGANPYWAFVLRDAGGAGAAPQGELQPLTAYTTATGVFASAAFTVAVGIGDEILIIHPALAAALIAGWLATGTLTTSNATVPADTGRTEANDYWNGSWLMTLTGAVRMQPRLIVDFANAGGVFTLDTEQPFTAAPGLVAYVILPPNSQLVPAADSASNQTPAHVVGNKADTIPAMNLAPGNDSIVRQIKAILERLGATPADPDDSLLTSVGQRDAAATADDLSDITTTDAQAKLRRLLLRFSSNAFSATIQGGAQTDVETMLGQMATYFVALGAAMSIQVNGNLARTNLQQVWQDFSVIFAADGANVFNPTIQGAARTDFETALNALATYLTAAGAAMSIQVNGNAARTNLEQVIEDLSVVLGADGVNVFNPTIQGAARTDLDTALAQLATYFVAAGAAMALQVNGNAARTNLQQALNDYFAVVGCDGVNVFSTTIQGVARTTIETAFDGLAAYFVTAGAALSVTIDPGGAARTTLATLWNDLGQMLAGAAGITTWPAAAAPGNGISIAEAIRRIFDDLVIVDGYHDVPVADVVTNAQMRDVVGNKTDAAVTAVGVVASIIAYIKGLLNQVATVVTILAGKLNVHDVVIYPVAEDAGVPELADDGSSPAFYPAAAHSTNANAEGAPGIAWSEDINFEQEGTINIISIYAEFEWQTRFLVGAGGGTQSSSKIQISRDGGASWVDLSDNFNNAAIVMTGRNREGVGLWVSTIVAGANQLAFRLVHWTDDAVGAVSTSEAQIRSNSYVRITYRKS